MNGHLGAFREEVLPYFIAIPIEMNLEHPRASATLRDQERPVSNSIVWASRSQVLGFALAKEINTLPHTVHLNPSPGLDK